MWKLQNFNGLKLHFPIPGLWSKLNQLGWIARKLRLVVWQEWPWPQGMAQDEQNQQTTAALCAICNSHQKKLLRNPGYKLFPIVVVDEIVLTVTPNWSMVGVHDCGSWVILQITRFPLSSLTRSLTTPQSTSLSACALRDVCASKPHLRAGAHSETWSVEETVLQKACFWQDYAGCSSVCQGECAGKPNQFGAKNHAFLFTKSYIVVVNQLHQLTPSPAAQDFFATSGWSSCSPFPKLRVRPEALFFEEKPGSYNLLVRHTLMGFYNLWRITPLVLNVWRLRAPTFFMFMG